MKTINLTKILFGTFLVFLGIGFLADKFLGLNFSALLKYFWPVVIMLLGLLVVLTSRTQILWGSFIFLVGLVVLVSQIVNLPFSVWDLWPLVLVAVGLRLLFTNSIFDSNSKVQKDGKDFFESVAIFFGDTKKIASSNLKKGKITVIFGGSEVDLRESDISKDGATIDLLVLFGGATIIVNKQTHVISDGMGLIGAFEDKTNSSKEDSTGGVLKISGLTLFGGVEIKN